MKKVDGLNIAIGRTVKELREQAGLTQEELAAKCETSSVYISEIERGIKNPSSATLMQLALSLEMKMSDLVLKIEEQFEYK
ncbi:MAG: helix-turn-helix transcriptional regulator [Balneolaceae bacterium]